MHPSDFGLPVYDSARAEGGEQGGVGAVHPSARWPTSDGPVRDIVLLNAGAALYCANVAASVSDGVKLRARGGRLGQGARPSWSQFVAVRPQAKLRRPPKPVTDERAAPRSTMTRHPGAHRRGQARGGRGGQGAAQPRIAARRRGGARRRPRDFVGALRAQHRGRPSRR